MCTFYACKKEKTDKTTVLTECLEIKLEEFKQVPGAARFIRINRPSGPLYWLVNDAIADEGEPVFNDQCEMVCKADCYCVPTGNLVLCDGSFLDFPRDTIWKR